MCGIIGYKGPKNAIKVVFEGIKNLEYRGYDSWGIACIGPERVHVARKIGRIAEMSDDMKDRHANIAISHSRWATHGGVTEENAHPHVSCDDMVAVAHNGIIDNYTQLRKTLEEKGHKFKSECDSEVIAHLIEDHLKRHQFAEAVRMTARELKDLSQ